jgi:hypothetical protein
MKESLYHYSNVPKAILLFIVSNSNEVTGTFYMPQ